MLTIKNLNKSYRKKIILSNAEYNFEKGKIYGVVGANGAGKSTFSRAILGFEKANSIDITLDGQKLHFPYPLNIRRQIVYIPDSPYTHDALDIEQNIKFIADLFKIENFNSNSYLERYKLTNLRKTLVKDLSKGSVQKVMMLPLEFELSDCKLYLLDEPTVALDAISIDLIKDRLLELKKRATVLIISHDNDFLSSIVDEFVLVKDGKLTQLNDFNTYKQSL